MVTFLSKKDRASSTLDGAITVGATSLSVAAGEGTKYPVGNFEVTIDNERVLVVARSGDDFTSITRAQAGTSAAPHSNGAAVELRITAAQLQEHEAAINTNEGALGDKASITHAAEHEDGGADEVAIEALATGEADPTKELRPDGAGGVGFFTPAPAAASIALEALASTDLSNAARAQNTIAVGGASLIWGDRGVILNTGTGASGTDRAQVDFMSASGSYKRLFEQHDIVWSAQIGFSSGTLSAAKAIICMGRADSIGGSPYIEENQSHIGFYFIGDGVTRELWAQVSDGTVNRVLLQTPVTINGTHLLMFHLRRADDEVDFYYRILGQFGAGGNWSSAVTLGANVPKNGSVTEQKWLNMVVHQANIPNAQVIMRASYASVRFIKP